MKTVRENATLCVHITYYTDPLCCWSWGLEKHWLRLKHEYSGKMTWRNCMGGLLPDWKQYRDDLHAVSRPIQMGPVWMEAAQLTETNIRHRIWMEDPPASSYLSCIAVKCTGLQSAQAEEHYLQRLREAVMRDGKNISFASVLIEIATSLAKTDPSILDVSAFEADLTNGHGLEAFRKDLDEVRNYNITRFPTLIFKSDVHAPLIITGFRPYESLAATMEMMLGR